MPKNGFWDISVKIDPKSKKFFLVIKLTIKTPKMMILIKIIINDDVHSIRNEKPYKIENI